MNKVYINILLSSAYIFLQASQLPTATVGTMTDDERKLLSQERNTNLVILNDFSELRAIKKDHFAIAQTTKKALEAQEVALASKSVFLAAKIKYGEEYINNLMENYICKEADGNYLLLIPKKMQDETKSKYYQDAFIGLAYNKLPDFDYENISQKESEIQEKGRKLKEARLAGETLLNIFKKLKVENIAREEEPFVNIYLSGHGEKNLIAGIRFDTDKNSNSFLKLVKFFNENIRTKSLFLLSCSIGGSQIINTYGSYDKDKNPVFDKFSNQILDSLNYPIINGGILYKEIYAISQFNFKDYFEALNKSTPDYQKILHQIKTSNDQRLIGQSSSAVLQNSEELSSYQKISKQVKSSSLSIVDNYLGIKLPHTSWFSPVEFTNETQTLSQVDMSTRNKPVIIKPTTKVLILGANYVEQPVVLENIPVLMPVNYYNQSYYFKNILYKTDFEDDLFSFLKNILFNDVKTNDEVNVLFENIQIGNKVYSNVHCFLSQKENEPMTKGGFTYKDSQGRVFKHYWESSNIKNKKDFNLTDRFIKTERMEEKEWDAQFDQMKSDIKDSLAPAMKKEFILGLSGKIGKKKVLNLKNLEDLSILLDKNSINPDDMDSIIPLLKRSLMNPDTTSKVQEMIIKLLNNHTLNSTNISVLLPVLKEGFNSSVNSVRTESYSLLKVLIDEKNINQKNWSDFVPLLKELTNSSHVDVVKFVQEIIFRLFNAGIVQPKNQTISEFTENISKNGLTDKDLDNLKSYDDDIPLYNKTEIPFGIADISDDFDDEPATKEVSRSRLVISKEAEDNQISDNFLSSDDEEIASPALQKTFGQKQEINGLSNKLRRQESLIQRKEALQEKAKVAELQAKAEAARSFRPEERRPLIR